MLINLNVFAKRVSLRLPFKIGKKKIIYGCEARGDAHSPYLTRYTLFECKYFQVMIHYFHRSDWTDDWHDHPWNFLSLILRTGYYEDTPNGGRFFPAGSLLFRRADYRHTIKVLTGLQPQPISLVITGRAVRDWFFYVATGCQKLVAINWRAYLKLMKCSDEHEKMY